MKYSSCLECFVWLQLLHHNAYCRSHKAWIQIYGTMPDCKLSTKLCNIPSGWLCSATTRIARGSAPSDDLTVVILTEVFGVEYTPS